MTTFGGATGFTVNLTDGDSIPRPVARISVVPAETLLDRPFWSIVATLVTLDCQEKSTPGTSLLPASNARALNCCPAPALMVAEGGETSTREIAGVQDVKVAPLICVPGLKARAPPLAVRCGAKLPVMSGKRVTDWLFP